MSSTAISFPGFFSDKVIRPEISNFLTGPMDQVKLQEQFIDLVASLYKDSNHALTQFVIRIVDLSELSKESHSWNKGFGFVVDIPPMDNTVVRFINPALQRNTTLGVEEETPVVYSPPEDHNLGIERKACLDEASVFNAKFQSACADYFHDEHEYFKYFSSYPTFKHQGPHAAVVGLETCRYFDEQGFDRERKFGIRIPITDLALEADDQTKAHLGKFIFQQLAENTSNAPIIFAVGEARKS